MTKTMFETLAAHDEEKASRHKCRTRYQAGEYRAVCSCSWVGPTRDSNDVALRDGEGHHARAVVSPRVPAHGHSEYSNHGCRCEICTAANREHHAEYMRPRRERESHRRALEERIKREADEMRVAAVRAVKSADVQIAMDLRVAGATLEKAKQDREAAVERAVAAGWSWAQIGDALGLGKHGAYALYQRMTRKAGAK